MVVNKTSKERFGRANDVWLNGDNGNTYLHACAHTGITSDDIFEDVGVSSPLGIKVQQVHNAVSKVLSNRVRIIDPSASVRVISCGYDGNGRYARENMSRFNNIIWCDSTYVIFMHVRMLDHMYVKYVMKKKEIEWGELSQVMLTWASRPAMKEVGRDGRYKYLGYMEGFNMLDV